jgi:hypothetical protein
MPSPSSGRMVLTRRTRGKGTAWESRRPVLASFKPMGAIYLRHGGTYVAMTEQPYESEDVLQQLLEQHPEMLADQAADHGGLLLIRREVPVRDAEEGGGRWRLDHLYVDAGGVPTLVEVKRSSDTRRRRDVVAQMLDYAANAKASFSTELMAAWVEETSVAQASTAAELLSDVLGVDDPDAFWQTVATNLDAERFRLIFVSDVIPPELRRIIEFLNGQMTQTEVLAIEVKQYTDTEGQQQTIVPRVIGDTSEARTVKRARSRAQPIEHDDLLAALEATSADAASAATAILRWAADHPVLQLSWSSAADVGLPMDANPVLRLWPEATIEVRLSTLRSGHGWDDAQIDELVKRLEQIPGVNLGQGRRWPRTALAPLAENSARERLIAIVDEVASELRPRP